MSFSGMIPKFQGHVDPQPIDGPAAFAWQADKNGPWYFNNAVVGTEDAEADMKNSGAKSYKLVKGWFEDTLATFVAPSRIAIMRIDCDWYASTMTCLRALFPHLAEDGILIADGYPDWDGYARAIHEYLAAYEGMARIKQFDGRFYYRQRYTELGRCGEHSSVISLGLAQFGSPTTWFGVTQSLLTPPEGKLH